MTDATVVGQSIEDAPSAAEGAVVTYSAPREPQTALYELGTMSDAEFDSRIATLKAGVARIETLQRSLLTEGTDWGTVPGVPKAFLFKPGAEKLALFYHLVPEFQTSVIVTPQESGIDRIDYTTSCLLHLQSHEGPVVGSGIGVASSWEGRYRWRNTERICPVCGKGAVIKGNPQYGGGWLCWKKKDGCGTKWADGSAAAQAFENEQVGRAENEDPHDIANTLAKMSEKRAHVDAVIRATGSSGIFTQDEDSPTVAPPDTAAPPVPSGAAQRDAQTSPRTPTGRSQALPVGATSLTGEVTKVADGIRRETDGNAIYDVTFKADGKTFHAITEGAMAERMVREVKPSAGDPITVEGRYVERDWEKDGKPMTGRMAVKEIRDITRIVIRDDILLGGETADPPSVTTTGQTAPMETSSEFGEVGYQFDSTVDIVSAQRLTRKSGPVIFGSADWEGAVFEFCTVTDHDVPQEGDIVRMAGTFKAAPGGRILLLGDYS